MPSKAELSRRGGLKRIRTVELPDGKYAHIYVVKRAGPRGGHTIMGEAKRRKRR